MTNTLSAYKARGAAKTISDVNNGVVIFDDFLSRNTLFTLLGTNPTTDVVYGNNVALGRGLYYAGSIGCSLSSTSDYFAIRVGSLEYPLSYTNSNLIKYQTRITFKTNGGISTSGSKQKFSFQLLGLSSDVSIYFDADVSNYWCTHFADGNLIDSHYTTSVLVDDSDFYLKIVVNQTSTYFYINNVLVRTETHGSSDLSKGTVYNNAFTINITNTKLDNGSTIGFECDAVKLEQTLSVDRQFT